jgi:hypothetical protein
MTPAMQQAVRAAIHGSYSTADVMRLCADGLEQRDGDAGVEAFRMIAAMVEGFGRELDEAYTAEPLA